MDPRMGILENGGTNFHSNVSCSYLEKRNFKIDFELIRATNESMGIVNTTSTDDLNQITVGIMMVDLMEDLFYKTKLLVLR
jgi:hypothetical protein